MGFFSEIGDLFNYLTTNHRPQETSNMQTEHYSNRGVLVGPQDEIIAEYAKLQEELYAMMRKTNIESHHPWCRSLLAEDELGYKCLQCIEIKSKQVNCPNHSLLEKC